MTALIVGIVLGTVAPGFAVSLRPFGDGFVEPIQMIIAPLVFCVVGVGSQGDDRTSDSDRLFIQPGRFFNLPYSGSNLYRPSD